jgi:leader peptidase (prepilin peptidase) / N-methyltransferase
MMIVAVACLGLIVGSFLNVCIHRLPLGESVVWPSSRCPGCRTPIKPYDNIPVIGYLMLKGRCRVCGAPIAALYPLVELLTMSLMVAAYVLYPLPLMAQRMVFACAMIVLFFVDLKHHRLPNEITLPGIVVGLACSFFMPPGWISAFIGAAAGGGILWFLSWIWFVVRHEEGMGFGDVKMLAMIGAFLGWQLMLAAFLVSTILGSVVGVGLIVNKRGNLKTALPFGCFLAFGSLLASAGGERAVHWYLSLFQ